MPRKEQWRIDLDREIAAEKKSKHCICGREKVIGELFCDMCEEEANYLLDYERKEIEQWRREATR